MDISKIIQVVIGIVSAFVGIAYFAGLAIVNFHLSKYGISNYQLLRAKYLAVGGMFIFSYIMCLIFISIPLGYIISSTQFMSFPLIVFSYIASFVLGIIFLNRSKQISIRTQSGKNIITPVQIWVIITGFIALNPVLTSLRVYQLLQDTAFGNGSLAEPLLDILVIILIAVWGVLSSASYYARHLYDESSFMFGVDLFASGAPVKVRLLIDSNIARSLPDVSIVMEKRKNATKEVLLLDETDRSYLLGVFDNGKINPVEITKDIVKAIQYLGIFAKRDK